MNELQSLALLVADMNQQIRSLQAENAALREQLAAATKQD